MITIFLASNGKIVSSLICHFHLAYDVPPKLVNGQQILCHRGIDIINYIDDISSAAISKEDAIEFGTVIDKTASESGLCLAEDKSINATQKMTFLGISFNSSTMTMEVTKERLIEIDDELKKWTSKKKATKQEIQSLAGKLQFIAKCCKPGQCFMARILATLKNLKRQSHKVYLNEEFRKGVWWWINFLPHFKSTSIIKTVSWSEPDEVFAKDACLKGGGGTYKNRYFSLSFPEEFLGNITGISQLEAIMVIMAIKLWSDQLHGRKFIIKCDNDATVSVVNTGRATDIFLQHCAREITFLAFKHEFEIKAIHIPGVDNRLPDWLTRACLHSRYMKKFRVTTDDSWIRDTVEDDMLKFSCTW